MSLFFSSHFQTVRVRKGFTGSLRMAWSMIQSVVIAFSLLMFEVGLGLAADKPVKYAGTFTSFSYHREGGDLVGVEIKIVPVKGRYQGALQIAEGGPSPLMVVDILFDKDKVRFEIPGSYAVYGGGIFDGKIDSKGIKGTIKFKSGGEDEWDLKRNYSYWDK